MDFQATDNWRVTGRYMNKKDDQEQPYGTTWSGAGSDNLDTIDTFFETPGTNWLVSTTGILNSSHGARVESGTGAQFARLHHPQPQPHPSAAGVSALPLLLPGCGAG